MKRASCMGLTIATCKKIKTCWIKLKSSLTKNLNLTELNTTRQILRRNFLNTGNSYEIKTWIQEREIRSNSFSKWWVIIIKKKWKKQMRTKRRLPEVPNKSTAKRNKKSQRTRQKCCIKMAFPSLNKTKTSKYTNQILKKTTLKSEQGLITEDRISLKISSLIQHSQVSSWI